MHMLCISIPCLPYDSVLYRAIYICATGLETHMVSKRLASPISFLVSDESRPQLISTALKQRNGGPRVKTKALGLDSQADSPRAW